MASFEKISSEQMGNFMEVLGFSELSIKERTGNLRRTVKEKVYEKDFGAGKIRIYSSIAGVESRDVGKDAIRVQYWVDGVKVYGATRVHRVKNWRNNVLNRIYSLEDMVSKGSLRKVPKDSSGSPMVVRKARRGGKKFWGSSNYPRNNETRRFDAAVVMTGKPVTAVEKAMAWNRLIKQADLHQMLMELEHNVRIGLIDEDEIMSSLKEKFGAEDDVEIQRNRATKLLNDVLTNVYNHFNMRSGYANRDGIQSITNKDMYQNKVYFIKSFRTGVDGEQGTIEWEVEREYDDTTYYQPSEETEKQIEELQNKLRWRYGNYTIEIELDGGGDKAYKYGLSVMASIKADSLSTMRSESFEAEESMWCACGCDGKIADHDDRGYGCWPCIECGDDSDTDINEMCSDCELDIHEAEYNTVANSPLGEIVTDDNGRRFVLVDEEFAQIIFEQSPVFRAPSSPVVLDSVEEMLKTTRKRLNAEDRWLECRWCGEKNNELCDCISCLGCYEIALDETTTCPMDDDICYGCCTEPCCYHSEEAYIDLNAEDRDESERMTRAEAEALADKMTKLLNPFVDFVEVCGSYRRGREDPGDLDIVIILKENESLPAIVEKLVGQYTAVNWLGEKKTQIVVDGVKVDIKVSSLEGLGAALLYFTGPGGYNIGMRRSAKSKGLKLNEYGIWTRDTNVYLGGATEEEIYAVLDKTYKPPEMRAEDYGVGALWMAEDEEEIDDDEYWEPYLEALEAYWYACVRYVDKAGESYSGIVDWISLWQEVSEQSSHTLSYVVGKLWKFKYDAYRMVWNQEAESVMDFVMGDLTEESQNLLEDFNPENRDYNGETVYTSVWGGYRHGPPELKIVKEVFKPHWLDKEEGEPYSFDLYR